MKAFIFVWILIQVSVIGMVNADIQYYKLKNKCIVEHEYSLVDLAIVSVVFPLAYIIPIDGEYPVCK